MLKEQQAEVIEVSEDAYKQNSVYRPWPDAKPTKPAGRPDKGRPQ